MKLAGPAEPGERFSFDPRLCCCHNWVFMLDERGNQTGKEYCPDCGATCLRDRRTGIIEEYDGVAGFIKGRNPRNQPRKEFKRPQRRPFEHHPRPTRSS